MARASASDTFEQAMSEDTTVEQPKALYVPPTVEDDTSPGPPEISPVDEDTTPHAGIDAPTSSNADEGGKAPIKLKDAVGRNFTFPWHLANTWAGVSELLNQAFEAVEVIGPQVGRGRYDLMGPNGEIILPSVWEHVVQPGWSVSMAMWPISTMPSRPPPPPVFFPRPPPPPPGSVPRPPRAGHYSSDDEDSLPAKRGFGRSSAIPKKGKKSLAFFRRARHQSSSSSSSSRSPSPYSGHSGGVRRHTKLSRDMAHRTTANRGDLNLKLGLLHGKASRKRAMSPSVSVSSSGSSVSGYKAGPPGRHGGMHGGMYGGRPARTHGARPGGRPWGPLEWVRKRAPHRGSSDSDAGSSGADSEVPKRLQKLFAHGNSEKQLVVACKVQDRLVRRPTQPLNDTDRHALPPERLVISSARTCWEGPEKFSLATLELIAQKVKPPLPGGQSSSSAEGDRSTWLHVRRNTMNFHEFEDIAQFDLAKDRATSSVISHLLRRIRAEKLDDDWYIRPATILRCDTKVGETPAASAVFVSIPYLSPGPYKVPPDTDKSEGICLPRRLHEAFNMISATTDRDKDQEFRRNEGRATDQVLWVRQVWMLITESGLLTYGNISRKDLEGNNIAVREPTGQGKEGETVIQFMDDERKLYYSLLSNCKSFYELHIEVRNQLSRAGRDVDDADIQLEVSEGEVITAATWSSLLKGTDIPLIKISLTSSPFYSDGSSYESSDERSSYLGIGSGRSTSVRGSSSESEGVNRRDRTIVISGYRSRRRRRFVPEADPLEFLSISKPAKNEESEDSLPNIPELNRKVPPFLAWSSTDKSRSVSEGFKEGVGLTEAALLHLDKFPRSSRPLQDLYDAFDENIYEGMRQCSPEDFALRRSALGGANGGSSPSSKFRLPAGQSQVLIEEFFDLCVAMFEAFVSSGLPCSLTSKYFAALSMIIEDPTANDSLGEGAGNAVDGAARHDWVISRKEVAQYDFRPSIPGRHREYKCRDCDRGRIYSSRDKATAHLRNTHLVTSRSDEELWKCLISVRDARREWLEEEVGTILSASRDGIRSILRKLASIQDGVLFEGEFRAPEQGLPYVLLDAFKLIVAFVCALANTIHEIHWFYRDFEQGRRAKDMTCHKHKARKNVMERIGEAVSDLIRKADRALVSMTDETVHDRSENFMTSVGMHYVGLQIMCNLVRMPIHNNKKAAGLYEGYVKNLRSAVTRNPQKRQIPIITSLAEELNLLEEFNEWQTGPLKSLGYLLQPGTYHRDLRRATDRANLADLEVELFVRQIRELDKDARRLSQIVDLCTRLVRQVRELTEIMEGDQSRAVVVFTVVTVIFLPLSFVASYFSMGGGVDGLEMSWPDIQTLFWKISGPLTAGIAILCLSLTGRRSIARVTSAIHVPRLAWPWSRSRRRSRSRKRSPSEWYEK